MKTLILNCLAAYLTMFSLATFPVEDPWIGKRVFTQFGTVLKVGNTIVDDEGRSTNLAITGKDKIARRVYQVEHTNGEWLWLKDENSGVAGWVQSKYVIPYEQAIEFYTNQIRAEPRNATHYNFRGLVWEEKGEHDIAIADYGEAIRLEPGEAIYYNNRGSARNGKKEYDKAIADFNEAIRLDPNDFYAYLNRGNAWTYKKEYDRAIADYSVAIRLDPKYAHAYNNRASAWDDKQEYDKSIADYSEAI